MAHRARAFVLFTLALILHGATRAHAFGNGAGSCAHGGVGHGASETSGGGDIFSIVIGASGVDVPIATVPVGVNSVSGKTFKGFLLRVVRDDDGVAVGSFGEDMPSGTRRADGCERFATHARSHIRGYEESVMPWIVPTLDVGTRVRLEATIVVSYSVWYTATRTVVVGDGDADEGVKYDETRAPARAPGGAKAPSVDAALAGGWTGESPKDGAVKARDVGVVRTAEDVDQGRQLSDAAVVHGAVMSIALLIVSPVASLIARYGKKYDPWWFRAHRNAQCVALGVAVVAAYVICAARGWDKPWGPHGKYGLIVILLGAIQLFGGFIRKNVPRPEFRRWHRALGVGTSALAAYNCTIGAGMLKRLEAVRDPNSSASAAPHLVNLCLFAVAVVGVLLESHRRDATRRNKSVKSMV